MTKVIIGHRPELTAEVARKVFESHFHDKYDVYKTKMPAYDFVVKKNAWRGVIVKLKQKRSQTYFVFRRDIPPGTAPFTLFLVLGAVWMVWGLQALFSTVGGAGAFIGFLLWVALGSWLLSLVFSRPSRKIESEIKAFIEQAEEFKQLAADPEGIPDTKVEGK